MMPSTKAKAPNNMVMANRADPGISAARIAKIRASAPRKANSHQFRDNEQAVLADNACISCMTDVSTYFLAEGRLASALIECIVPQTIAIPAFPGAGILKLWKCMAENMWLWNAPAP